MFWGAIKPKCLNRSWSFVLIPENQPIRTSYSIDTALWLGDYQSAISNRHSALIGWFGVVVLERLYNGESNKSVS